MKATLRSACPKCNAFDVQEAPEWFVYCGDCGWMPNEEGYATKANAYRAWENWKPPYPVGRVQG